MRILATSMIGGAALLAMAGTAEASIVCGTPTGGVTQTITCTQSVTSNTWTGNSIATPTNTTLSVAAWDPNATWPTFSGYSLSNANLTSLQATLFGTTSGSVTVQRTGGLSGSVFRSYTANITKDFRLDLDTGSGTLFVNTNNVQPATQTLGLFWTQAGTAGFGSATGSTALTSTASGILSQYTLPGGGSINMALRILRDAIPATGSGTQTITYNDLASAYVGMLYTFTLVATPVEVPEPLTLALFGLGVAGLGIAVRRRPA